MKKILILSVLLFELSGCYTYVDSLGNWNDNNRESLEFTKNYCIYNYDSPRIGVCDKELQVPAHYQIYIPNKLKMMGGVDFDRFFLYSKNRGIAIFQDIFPYERKYTNGFRKISNDSVGGFLGYFNYHNYHIKVKENRHHYLYVDNEIRILIFNLSDADYNYFVKFPLSHLIIKRHGEMRKKEDHFQVNQTE